MAKPNKVQQSQTQGRAITRDLLVIDNRPLRQAYFLEVQKILQKIERLEDKIRLFHTSDQKLFNQWMDLTFRSHRTAIEQAQVKYHDLARFHNWVVATARKLGIEMYKAYILMREEQIRWNSGNEDVRREIDEAREQREAYIRQECRARYNESFAFDGDDEISSANGGIQGLGEILDEIENLVLGLDPQASEFQDSAEERIDRLNALSDEDLLEALENQEISFMLFDVSLSWGQTHHDFTLFKRVWCLMTPSQKQFFANVYASVTEEPIEDLLQDIGLSPDWNSEDDEEDPILDEDYRDRPPRFSQEDFQKPEPDPATDEKIKQIFRKLMRKLHPDMRSQTDNAEAQPPWVQRVWGLVQKAYNEKDLTTLERLLKLTLIRLNVLDELSVSEISEASQWLKKDLKTLEEESADMKRSPAWGFSKKKNYDSLMKKIEKEIEGDLQEILAQIEDLEHQHYLLEMLSRQPQRRSRTRSRGPRSRTGSRRPNSRYQEFFFDD